MRSQKILNYGRFIAIAFAIAIVPSCSFDNEDQIRSPELNAICELSSSDAEAIFNSEIEKLSNSEEPSKFGDIFLSQGLIEADWSKSASYRGTRTGIDNCEAPLFSEQSLIFYMRDDKGGRISLDSHQRVVVVRNPLTGNDGAYVMTIVADDSYTKTHKRIQLERDFRNDGRLHDFSGLIIYTKLSGKIVRVDRIIDGEPGPCVSMLGIKDRSDIFKRSISFKRIMDGLQVRKIHNALFPKRNYSFRSDSTWYYDEIDSTAYCYGDSTAYGDGDNPWWYLDTAFCFGNSDVPGPDDPSSDNPYENDQSQDPGSCGGGGGSIVIPGATNYLYLNTFADIKIKYGENIKLGQKLATYSTLEKLGKHGIASKLLKALNKEKVTIQIVNSISNENAEAQTIPTKSTRNGKFVSYSSVKLDFCSGGSLIAFLEEFFHAYQYLNAKQELLKGDVEFEAKAFIARFLAEANDPSLTSNMKHECNDEHFTSIYDYICNPNESNRIAALDAFVHLGYMNYPMSDDGRKLDYILKCYNQFYD